MVLEGPVGGITLREHVALSVLPALMQLYPDLLRATLIRIAFEYADEFIDVSQENP